jgi:hypothetical protein
MSFTPTQIEKIKNSFSEIKELEQAQKDLYENLRKYLNLEPETSETSEKTCPESLLFELIFNQPEEELENNIKKLGKHIEKNEPTHKTPKN